MKKFAIAVLAISQAALASPKLQPGSYALDPVHSRVSFEVPHLVISSVEGRFNGLSGELTLGEKLTDSKILAEVETGTVDTGVKDRDEHLRSADFFDVAKYPKLSFRSKKVTGTADGFKLIGDLTIKGVTKEVTFDGKYLGNVADAYGNNKAAFNASTKINRKDFGLTWNKLVEAGPAVGDQVTITLKLQATQARPKTTAQ